MIGLLHIALHKLVRMLLSPPVYSTLRRVFAAHFICSPLTPHSAAYSQMAGLDPS